MDEEHPQEPIADESHRLPEGQRLLAHFMIGEQYKKQQRVLTSSDASTADSTDESPFAEISIGDSEEWEA